MHDYPRQRLLHLVKERKTTLKAVSLQLGHNHAYLQQFIQRNKPQRLPERDREKLAELFGVSEAEFRPASDPKATAGRALLTFSGLAPGDDITLFEGRKRPDAAATPAIEAPPGYVAIDTLTVRAGLGGGAFDPDEHHGVPALFPTSLIEGELRGTARDFLLLEVQGHSMQPVLLSGDRVIVDLRKKDAAQGGLFALWNGDGLVVKWCERVVGSDPPRLRIMSENKQFSTDEVPMETARIVGLVVFFFRRI